MYSGHEVLVWGDIMLCSRTDLHIFDAGSVNGTRYCNEILLPYVRLFRGAMGLQFLFMDDNAPCHRTHVWDFLGRRLAARTLPPVTIRELRLALQDEWAAMPQQLIDTLYLSMGRRCETCLANVIDGVLRKVHGMMEANQRIPNDGVAKGLGIGHERAQKIQNPEFFLEGFLSLIKQYVPQYTWYISGKIKLHIIFNVPQSTGKTYFPIHTRR
ncbi:transposable element Tcb2 transposase [Trichonephila clavipes]|nr:transposable element Tcb2 transposase [Trichonephila clavipes]